MSNCINGGARHRRIHYWSWLTLLKIAALTSHSRLLELESCDARLAQHRSSRSRWRGKTGRMDRDRDRGTTARNGARKGSRAACPLDDSLTGGHRCLQFQSDNPRRERVELDVCARYSLIAKGKRHAFIDWLDIVRCNAKETKSCWIF